MPKPDPKLLRTTAASAVIFDHRGRVLLHQRTDNHLWSLPGGAIELDESAEAAVAREVLEETGYIVQVLRLIGIYSDQAITTRPYPDGDVVSYVFLLFECRAVGGSPQLSGETSAVEWFDPEGLPENFHRPHLAWIHDALAKQAAAFYR